MRKDFVSKKFLAGVLAASLVFSGTMVAFADNSDAAGTDAAAFDGSVDLDTAKLGPVAEKTTDGKRTDVIKFNDSIATDSATVSVVGVEVVNPFDSVEMDELLNETVAQAFTNSGKTFNGLTVGTGASIKVVTKDNTGKKALTTKAEAQTAYDTAVKALGSNPTPASVEAVKYTEFDGTVTPGAVSGEFAYPIPQWKQGITLSTWVKVAEGTKGSAPIFTFESKDQTMGLTLRTDGAFMFGDMTSNSVRNQYVTVFSGETPFANQGEWVYVTVSIKNDGAQVYYNGVEAAAKCAGNTSLGHIKTGSKLFNGGFGSANKEWAADRLKNLCAENVYQELLQNLAPTEDQIAAGDFSDVSKYKVQANKRIMELVTGEDTKLYIGGGDEAALRPGNAWQFYVFSKEYGYDMAKVCEDPENYYDSASCGGKIKFGFGSCSKYSEGLQVGNLSYTTEVIDELTVYALYKEAQEPGTVPPAETTAPAGTTTAPAGDTTTAPAGSTTTAPAGDTTTAPAGSTTTAPAGDTTTAPAGDTTTAPAGDTTTAPAEADYVPGDVVSENSTAKGDGKVQLRDAQYVLKVALKIVKEDTLTAEQKLAADVIGDDKIKLEDAQAILKRALKIPVTFKQEETEK